MNIAEYISNVKKELERGKSTEHSHRGYLQSFLSEFAPGFEVTNEPKRQACGAPDYIIAKKGVPVGFVETKDVGVDLGKIEKGEQLARYLASLDNLILTDYLEFRFYRSGSPVGGVRIATVAAGKVKAIPGEFPRFESMLKEFFAFKGQTVKSPDALARMMADKAKLMEEIIVKALESGESEDEGLEGQYEAFKTILINDLTHSQFADIYAQTIAYGLFAARLNDPSLEDFTRQEAGYLVPKTNPFLLQLFSYIAGPTLDDRVAWVVDALAEVFRACDVQSLLADFGKETMSTDPFIHFYETFLAEYNPALRKSRGVYYTPEPVVSFIVRSVDKILERDFGLPMGLADTSMTTIEIEKQGHAKKVKESVHRVQLLDPATGTGTFLMEVFKQIYSRYEGQQGLWQAYVEESLLPRVHGFEILMAPYAMCHLKLGMFLRQTGYTPKNPAKPRRLGVYLTNSLEEAHPDTGSLFAQWLTQEAGAANLVKRDAPVMVVLGNPPYSNFSQMNKGEWIRNLIADYKKDLNEKKINLDDDYIKFIRYAEYFIEKNGHGIVAMITNNSYIDGITHRKMREHLMQTFDDIYVLDLHGSAKKKEIAPDGGKDENVFDIQQGVAIVLMVRKQGRSKKMATVRHAELYGLREAKYHELSRNDVFSQKWGKIESEAPNYFFVPRLSSEKSLYPSGFSVSDLFYMFGPGMKTERDKITIHYSRVEIEKVVNDFEQMKIEELKEKYNIPDDSRDWKLVNAKSDIQKNREHGKFVRVQYRPFDYRYTFYTCTTRGFIGTPGSKTMRNMLHENIGLVFSRTVYGDSDWHDAFISNVMVEFGIGATRVGNTAPLFPLYFYPIEGELDGASRRPNLNMEIVNDIATRLSLAFISDHEASEAKTPKERKPKGIFTPLDLLDYIYAVLHNPSYRVKYREFLKIDFPRVPYPQDAESFFALAEKGAALRSFHLMDAPELNKPITTYPHAGNNSVDKIEWEGPEEDEHDGLGRVRINAEQAFEKVPRKAWDFWIGGYQPARKWLKDRKGRMLSADDIMHWQKIVVALVNTDRIMKEIEGIWKA